MGFVLF